MREINPSELTEIDYQILNFVEKVGFASKEDIAKKFKKIKASTIDYHVGQLAYSADVHRANSSYLYQGHQGNGFKYQLSDFGRKILKEYNSSNWKAKRKSIAEWARYIITTFIAVAALVLSIINKLG